MAADDPVTRGRTWRIGTDDIIFPDAAKVSMYAGWRYVLVEAGPEQAAAWRGTLPDMIFPPDRSWLLSKRVRQEYGLRGP